MSANIKPLFDRILIERDTLKSAAGIYIPDDVKQRTSRGTIIAVGNTVGTYRNGELIETVEVGWKVVFAKYAGTEIKEGDKEYWIVQDTDILARINEE